MLAGVGRLRPAVATGVRGLAMRRPMGGRRPGGQRGRKRTANAETRAAREAALLNAVVRLPASGTIGLRALAEAMKVPGREVLRELEGMGEPAASLDAEVATEVAELLAADRGLKVLLDESPDVEPETLSHRELAQDGGGAEADEAWPRRQPVITVMGHVDHGKTTLLDTLRRASVAGTEAGGITQHVAAFAVRGMTFLDTPGHAAFSAIRRSGSQATDMVVLVVSADDGVMPQTRECIELAREAHVPVIVAINKCDRDSANPDRVRQGLAAENVVVDTLGGDVQSVEVSALKGTNMDQLLEAVGLQAEMMNLRACVKSNMEAIVVEARREVGLGNVATVVVRQGTLTPGRHVVVGNHWARIKALRNADGKAAKRILPGQPADLAGLSGLPLPGEIVVQVESEARAKEIVAFRERRQRIAELKEQARQRKLFAQSGGAAAPAAQPSRRRGPRYTKGPGTRKGAKTKGPRAKSTVDAAEGDAGGDGDDDDDDEDDDEAAQDPAAPKVMPVILRADCMGSLDAVRHSLESLNTDEVQCKIIRAELGPASESDIEVAKSTGARVVCFNVRMPPAALVKRAQQLGTQVKAYKIIYELLDDVRYLMSDLLDPEPQVDITGQGRVLQAIELRGKRRTKVMVAGCRVIEGELSRRGRVRVLRGDEVVFDGVATSLRHFKEDVASVPKGKECGMALGDWKDVQPDDILQCYEMQFVPRILPAPSWDSPRRQ